MTAHKRVIPKNRSEPTEFKPRVTLKDIRYSWVDGELRKNGIRMTEAQCVFSLQNKHAQFGGKYPLTPKELHDIIYKDRNVYRQKVNAKTSAQIQMKKLEAEAKVTDLMKLRMEYQIEALSRKKEEDIIKEEVKRLMEESTPQEYNVEMYQRMNPQYVALAIQSLHPELSQQQVRLIIGSWVRRGL